MKRLIIYDLDGTLVDTLEDIASAANHMLSAMGAPRVHASEVRGYVGHGQYEMVRNCLKTDDAARIEAGARLYRAFYTEHMLDHSRLYAGARKVLEHFKTRRQAVITNKPDPYSSRILEALGVAGYLAAIVAGNSRYPKKPDPAAVLALMAQAQVRPDETLFIGDSSVDVETGQRAGVMTVGMTHGLGDEAELRRAGPDRLVDGFPGLLAMARDEGW